MSERMKILIAYDGSACADAALDDLQRAGLPREAEAQIISVTEVWLPLPPPSSYEIVEQAMAVHVPADLKTVYTKGSVAVEAAHALALQAAERVQAKFPDGEIKAESLCGSPAWGIIMHADEWKPDLIVVGSHGRSALGRLVLGSVSQKVLTEARCSVRVARGRVLVEPSPIRVLVGVDGSSAAEAAVQAVASRVWPVDSEVRVVVVDDPLTPTLVGSVIPPVGRVVEEMNREELTWAEKIADDAVQMLRAAELKVSSSIEAGDPKRILVEAAEQWDADCIFVGSTGSGNRLGRFLLGSVSSAVVARAHCSVEVVRARTTV
jgi:nucleotide-binding universal stress UspA family protein